jgi:hypothetical protein
MRVLGCQLSTTLGLSIACLGVLAGCGESAEPTEATQSALTTYHPVVGGTTIWYTPGNIGQPLESQSWGDLGTSQLIFADGQTDSTWGGQPVYFQTTLNFGPMGTGQAFVGAMLSQYNPDGIDLGNHMIWGRSGQQFFVVGSCFNTFVHQDITNGRHSVCQPAGPAILTKYVNSPWGSGNGIMGYYTDPADTATAPQLLGGYEGVIGTRTNWWGSQPPRGTNRISGYFWWHDASGTWASASLSMYGGCGGVPGCVF